MKMPDPDPQPQVANQSGIQGSSTHMPNKCMNPVNMKSSESHNVLLQEIDSYLAQINPLQSSTNMYCESTTSELPSLRELWQTDGAANVHKSMFEERLRRRHLEKNLEATQMELIEAQQKVSVALSVDQAKEAAINKLRTAIQSIHQQSMATEHELRGRIRELELDLKKSMERSKRAKEQNDALEQKVEHLTTASNDYREITKKQLEDLQIRLTNSLKAEQLINDDLVRTRNQLVIEKNCHRENQETWSRKEANYKGDQETLRGSLKHFYQKQLNDVVAEKMREFQRQMDDLEVQFKMEYLRRERQIAERAMAQMELISEKNQEEVRLLQERHQEEIKYVNLQLEMARTTISEAQQRLTCYGDWGDANVPRVKQEQTGTPKKVNNTKTPVKRNINFNPTTKTNSPELKNYIDTVRNRIRKMSDDQNI